MKYLLYSFVLLGSLASPARAADERFMVSDSAGESIVTSSSVKCVAVGLSKKGLKTFLIELDEKGETTWAVYTANHINQQVRVIVDGQVVVSPVIRSTMRGGKIVVVADTLEESQQLATTFAAFDQCKKEKRIDR